VTTRLRQSPVEARGSVIRTLADNSDSQSLATRLRRRRFDLFLSLLGTLKGHIEVLDIGGTQKFWDLMLAKDSPDITVTLLNVEHQPVSSPRFVSAVGDARSLPQFADGSFDVVFSNSVIEHIGDYANQRRMADEIKRVGQRYFVQTPNKRFPLEPHFLVPWFQYLPVSVRVLLINNFDVGWYKRIRDIATARDEIESIQLLTRKKFTALFPEAGIHEEKLAMLTKSFVAIGGWD
jgi:hypothetical protein